MARGELYTIVRAGCLGRRPEHAPFLVRVQLSTGALHAIARVPSGAISLAAAGQRLALTYAIGNDPEGRVRVEVLDSGNAKLLYTVAAPRHDKRRESYDETQIDAAGDVLVTSTYVLPPSSSAFGWWGNASTSTGRLLGANTSVVASLADGRIAYATGTGGVEHIDVLNLATGKTQTVVTFPGSARVRGIGMGKTRLAWAQQSYGYTSPTTGGHVCVSRMPVGPTELLETPLVASGGPIVVDGASVAPAGARLCPEV